MTLGLADLVLSRLNLASGVSNRFPTGASSPIQRRRVQQLDLAAACFEEPLALQRSQGRGHSRALDAKDLSNRILRNGEARLSGLRSATSSRARQMRFSTVCKALHATK